MELYSPWQNVTERDIKELKKSSRHKMLATGASQQLWNDCLDLEACIHSHSTNSVYHIDGKVTEMYVSRETVDIIYTFFGAFTMILSIPLVLCLCMLIYLRVKV